MNERTKHALLIIGKVIISVGLILAAGYFGLIGALLSGMRGLKFLAIAALLTPLAFIPIVWARNKRRFLVIGAVVLGVFWGIVGAQYTKAMYEKSLAVNTDVNIQLNEYLPFVKDSKIVKLPEESTLHLDTDLPIVDGAAAVFPVYSAFVNAVYPEGVTLTNSSDWYNGLEPDWFAESRNEMFVFRYSNTVNGYEALARKEEDIFFGAYPSEEQIAYAKEQGTEFEFTPIGREAFVFFVNAKSDVDNLSSEQIRDIYAGRVENWSELGFKPCAITAFQRNENSGSQSMFLRFMGKTIPETPPMEEVVDTMMGAYDTVADYVNHKGAIGFSFRYYIQTLIGRDDVKLISVDGVAPTVENIRSGAYPITGELYAVTWKGNPNPNVQRLLDWILGPQGQFIIEETGYVPIS